MIAVIGAVISAGLGYPGLVVAVTALGAFAIYATAAWCWHFVRGPVAIQQSVEDARDAAVAAREEADRERDAVLAHEPVQAVAVTMREPYYFHDDQLFRLVVRNDGDRAATYFGQVLATKGTLVDGPEAPWDLAWRGSGQRCTIPPGSEQFIDIARATKIDAVVAAQTEFVRWWPTFGVYVATNNDSRIDAARIAIEGGFDAVDGCCIELDLCIWHEQSHQVVVRPRVRLEYHLMRNTFVPYMVLA